MQDPWGGTSVTDRRDNALEIVVDLSKVLLAGACMAERIATRSLLLTSLLTVDFIFAIDPARTSSHHQPKPGDHISCLLATRQLFRWVNYLIHWSTSSSPHLYCRFRFQSLIIIMKLSFALLALSWAPAVSAFAPCT